MRVSTITGFLFALSVTCSVLGCGRAAVQSPGDEQSTEELRRSGGIVITRALHLDKVSVASGETVVGTVTYKNAGHHSVSLQTLDITGLPPGATQDDGPYVAFAPVQGPQSLAPQQSVTLTASLTIDSQTPTGTWHAYSSYQTSDGVWHGSAEVSFTVVGGTPTPPPPAPPPGTDSLAIGSSSADQFDSLILSAAAQYQFGDPMLLKAMMAQESDFDYLAVSPDSPCGIPQGWTDAEAKSFGLLQLTPACETWFGLLPNGHPNLTTDRTSSLWATSVFNPSYNITGGAQAMSLLLDEMKQRFSGCTSAQYNLMAAGAYNSGSDAISGCGSYNSRASTYVSNVLSHYRDFAAKAGWPNPY